MQGWTRDLRFAARRLGRTPGTTAIAIFTLTVGICGVATVFGWMQSVLLVPLPGVERPEGIVAIETTTPSGSGIDSSYLDFLDFSELDTAFSDIAVFQSLAFGLQAEGRTERVWGLVFSPSYFELLELEPALGRWPSRPAPRSVGSPAEVVLAHAYWQRRFGGDGDIIGTVVRIDDRPFEVVGIAPEDFIGTIPGLRYDLWLPVSMMGELRNHDWLLESRRWRWLHCIARLETGVSIEQAQAELDTRTARLQQVHPEENRGMGARVLPFSDAPFGAQSALRPVLGLLLGAGLLVLVIACANVASLLFAQGRARSREVAVRLATGASGFRVLRQFLTEGALLAGLAGLSTLVALPWTLDLLVLFLPTSEMPIAIDPVLDRVSVAFIALLVLSSTVLFATLPALRAIRIEPVERLRGGSRIALGQSEPARLLVAAEIALAMVALVGSGLFLQNFSHLRQSDVGFDPEGVLLVQMGSRSAGHDVDQGRAFFRRSMQELGTLPGVETVALADWAPLGLGGISWEEVEVGGYVPAENENTKLWRARVSESYFETLRIPVLEGRPLARGDDEQATPVVVVNRTLAERYWPGESAIGRQIVSNEKLHTVVGVVADGKYQQVIEAPQPFLYFSIWQHFEPTAALHVRVSGGQPERYLPVVLDRLQAVDPKVPVFGSSSLARYTEAATVTQSMAASLLTVLAAIALLLSIVGLYGVINYTLGRRIPEIGLRQALGADRAAIANWAFADVLRLLAIGLGGGLGISLALSGMVRGQLHGVTAFDPLTYGLAAAVVVISALGAGWPPIRKALAVSPAIALRGE